MSTANAMPSVKEAFDNALGGIRQRVFFHHLGTQYGIEPKNVKQAQALLNMADNLRMVEEDATVKAAADAHDPFLAADAALANVLAQNGFQAPPESVYKDAGDAFFNDPTLYDSILVLAASDADQAFQNLKQQRQSA